MGTVTNTTIYPVDLADGRSLAPGESADDIDTNLPHHRALVLDGDLRVSEGSTPRKRQPEKRVAKAEDKAKSAESAGDDEKKE